MTMGVSPAEIERLVGEAKSERTAFASVYAQIAMRAVPHRQVHWAPVKGIQGYRENHTSFPQIAAEEFANRIKSGIAPAFRQWVTIEPSPNVPDRVRRDELRRMAQPANRAIQTELDAIAAGSQLHQVLLDAAIGVGCIHVGTLITGQIVIETVPPRSLLLLAGHADGHSMIGRQRELKVPEIIEIWPDANVAKLSGYEETRKVNLAEVCIRRDDEREETWDYVVYAEVEREILYHQRLVGAASLPFMVFRWNPIPESGWAVGPFYVAMPEMESLNELVYRIKQSVSFNALPPMVYDSNSTINFDTIVLEPGVWLPKDAGSDPPEALQMSGELSFGFAEVRELQETISRALFLDRLGPVTGPVKSATEILQRQAELARVIGAPYMRLMEFLARMVGRIVMLMALDGRIDGILDPLRSGELIVKPSGPFARQQQLEEVQTIQNFIGILAQMFGPETALALIDAQRVVAALAEHLDLPPDFVRSPAEIEKILKLAQQMQVQRAQTQQGAAA